MSFVRLRFEVSSKHFRLSYLYTIIPCFEKTLALDNDKLMAAFNMIRKKRYQFDVPARSQRSLFQYFSELLVHYTKNLFPLKNVMAVIKLWIKARKIQSNAS